MDLQTCYKMHMSFCWFVQVTYFTWRKKWWQHSSPSKGRRVPYCTKPNCPALRKWGFRCSQCNDQCYVSTGLISESCTILGSLWSNMDSSACRVVAHARGQDNSNTPFFCCSTASMYTGQFSSSFEYSLSLSFFWRFQHFWCWPI